ncbi:cyclase family protein [Microbacterium tumbae]
MPKITEAGRPLPVPEWVRRAAEDRHHAADLRGTLNRIDEAAAARAAAEIRLGRSVSLSRPLSDDDFTAAESAVVLRHERELLDGGDGIGWSLSHLRLDPHGLQNTHLDALNHVAVGGTYYGGRSVDDPRQGSIDVLAGSGVITRAVYVDIPALRETEWADRPVEGDDIQAALQASGVEFLPGDALCLDMGRDRFEASAGRMLGGPESPEDAGGGLAESGARWVADNGVSVLAWDMLDSREAKAAHATAHILGWAIGLPLVDNCDSRPCAPRSAGAPGSPGRSCSPLSRCRGRMG